MFIRVYPICTLHIPVNCNNLIIFNKQKSLIILRRRSLYLIISLSQQIFIVCDGDLHHKLSGTDYPDSSGPGCLCGDPARVQTPTLCRGRAHTASPVTPLLPQPVPDTNGQLNIRCMFILCCVKFICNVNLSILSLPCTYKHIHYY